jgi:hypothetical protein
LLKVQRSFIPKNMFGKTFQPKEISDQLQAVVRDGAAILGGFQRSINPDEAERTRLLFTAQLLPIAVSFLIIARRTKSESLKRALSEAHTIYLDGFADQNQIVSVGDYIIWRVERDSLARALREIFGQIILATGLNAYEMRYGMLLHVVSDIRKQSFECDVQNGLNATPNPKQGLSFAFMSAGVTFTRQVLQIDPNDPTISRAQQERFNASVGLLASFIGQSFFSITDMATALGA